MQQKRFNYLLEQYKGDLLTAEESEELMEFCRADHEAEILAMIRNRMETQALPAEDIQPKHLQSLLTKILSVDKWDRQRAAEVKAVKSNKIHRSRYLRFLSGAAAVILLLIAAGVYYGVRHSHEQKITAELQPPGQDVAPGGNRAVLTLANGSIVALDSVHTGQLASQGNVKVVKVAGGVLAYRQSMNLHGHPAPIEYNTLTTPRGGQYELMLPDGTRVWLNAASSIRFPAGFTGKEREVEVTGECYFEIATDAAMPFVVKKGDIEVQVLGTHFNVNAYDDEADMRITLLEGAVKVTQLSTHKTQSLRPGQQAEVDAAGRITLNENVDAEQVIAWKNGKFKFDNTELTELMRQLARWYNVRITYTGDMQAYADRYAFMGEIERKSDLSTVLKLLELGGVHFKIEGRDLLVMP